jgi:ParB family chromosome partitioning protein
MRLLDLAPQVQSWLTQDRISVGHAKVLLSLKSHEEQAILAEEIIRRSLTVRAAEQLVARHFVNAGAVKPTRGQSSTARVRAGSPQSCTSRTGSSVTLRRTSPCIMARNAGRSRSSTTARTICNRILGAIGLQPEEA